MTTKFGIWCEVWGGVTGARSAWLKEDGEVVEFLTLEAADAEAKALTRAMNHPHAKASFRYSAARMQIESV